MKSDKYRIPIALYSVCPVTSVWPERSVIISVTFSFVQLFEFVYLHDVTYINPLQQMVVNVVFEDNYKVNSEWTELLLFIKRWSS